MGIRKKESSSSGTLLIITVVLVILIATCTVVGKSPSPMKVFIDSYGIKDDMLPADLVKIALNLEKSLEACEDSKLVFRIKYRIGVLLYKAGKINEACLMFEQTATEANCPLLVRISSLNMAGQIHRLLGQTKKSLETFDNILTTTEKSLTTEKYTVPPIVLKLAALAVFGRGEIYQQQEKYKLACQEYKRLFNILQYTGQDEFDRYKAICKDRMAQLYLIDGNSTGYLKASRDIVKSHPKYYRVALIEFEMAALELLSQDSYDMKFPRGSFDVPVRLVVYATENPNDEKVADIISWLEKHSTSHENNYSIAIVNYHYAWLLDVTGKHQEAADMLGRISQVRSFNGDEHGFLAPLLKDLDHYACLQRATILGEVGEYKAAIKSAHSIPDDPNNIHLSSLTESIKEGLETLKREVPKNESQ